MDKGTANRWSWLPAMMPGVQRLMAEKRAAMGAPHVAECWRRGVMLREAGWFYAREGAIAIGTPWGDDIPDYTHTQAMVLMRNPGAAHGAG